MEFSFNARIARLTHSTDEAVFVHRIWYLTLNNEANEQNFQDGKYWTYDSVQALAKVFDFWTPKQLRRIISNCEKNGLIEIGNFARNPFDRRCWYTLGDAAKAIYQDGENDLPKRANAVDQTGDVSFAQTGNCTFAQTGESSSPDGQMYIRPNGQMIKGAIIRPIKDKKENAPARSVYGEFGNVYLSDADMERLHSRWSTEQVTQEIEELSSYMASKGKQYKNHCATLSNWLRRKYPEKSGSKLIEEDWVNGG